MTHIRICSLWSCKIKTCSFEDIYRIRHVCTAELGQDNSITQVHLSLTHLVDVHLDLVQRVTRRFPQTSVNHDQVVHLRSALLSAQLVHQRGHSLHEIGASLELGQAIRRKRVVLRILDAVNFASAVLNCVTS